MALTAIGSGCDCMAHPDTDRGRSSGWVSRRPTRTKWTNVHTDEVYFRDTAHGLLVWAVGIVITAGFLASAATSFAGAERSANQLNSSQDSSLNPNAYFVDTLLRGSGTTPEKTDANERAEISRTITHDLQEGSMSDGDRAYLAQFVSTRTGLNPSDSDKRVTAVFSEIQESAEHARKALAHLSLWLFVALLSGAFSCELCRDDWRQAARSSLPDLYEKIE